MYEGITQEILLARMLGSVSPKLDTRPDAVIYDTHSATAIELQNLYIELEYLLANSYGDTAAREYLTLLCKDRGITPKPATHAILKGEFTPDDIDVTGQRFNIGEINYVVTGKDEQGQYEVQCESVGRIGNQYLGEMIPMEYIRGLRTARLTGVSIPGEDEEDTEELRKRYFDSFHEHEFGGNRADYLAKVRSIGGVGDCKITRVWNGDIRPADMIPSDDVRLWYEENINKLDKEAAAWLSAVYTAACEKKLTVGGTVLVTVVESEKFGEAEAGLLSNIQKELDPPENAGEGYGFAPIGHVISVKSAVPFPVDVTVNIDFEEGFSWNNMTAPIEEAVKEYLLELRKKWAESSFNVVRISQVESKILALTGIVDIRNTKLNGSSDNISLGESEIPVLGGVSDDKGG